MIIWLICRLLGHRMTLMVDRPAIFIDKSILKDKGSDYLGIPGRVIDVNMAMLPPNMPISDVICSGPVAGEWVKASFCLRCGKNAKESK